MPHFHAVALFESRGSSFEAMDHAVTSLLASVSHKRLHYYEHETIEGPGPHGDAINFVVFAEFDVEAHTEEKATDLVDDVLDEISTEEIQYFTHGLLPGKPRVRQTPRTSSQDEPDDQDADTERRDSRGGRRRGTRGRGRSRANERGDERRAVSGDTAEVSAEQGVESESREAEARYAETAEPAPEAGPAADVPDDQSVPTAPASQPSVDAAEVEDLFAPEEPEPPPARSSSSMQVKTAVTLRASELGHASNGETAPDQDALLTLATAEARRRHPELPGDIAPESHITSLPWGDIVLTLTWSYDVPVPSAAEGG